MPYATTTDQVKLYFEEAGSGTPILFIHEFAADYASWEPQIRYFSRSHRCIVYSARGYTPSDVPDKPDAYSYKHFYTDALAIIDHLKIKAAHLVGLSMGAYSALQVGINAPERALSLTLASAGSGFEAERLKTFRDTCLSHATEMERGGSEEVAKLTGMSPGRIPFLVKDPRGFREFYDALAKHDHQGSAHTQRGFQAARPPISEFKDEMKKLKVPTLIIVGDEDDGCIASSLFMKANIPPSGLAMFPKTGHVLNQEEPALFNETVERFLALAEAGRWPDRDPRSVRG